eukprot:SAG31_NODE_9125_length_1329_cov_2.232520_1_plen_177_part_00
MLPHYLVFVMNHRAPGRPHHWTAVVLDTTIGTAEHLDSSGNHEYEPDYHGLGAAQFVVQWVNQAIDEYEDQNSALAKQLQRSTASGKLGTPYHPHLQDLRCRRCTYWWFGGQSSHTPDWPQQTGPDCGVWMLLFIHYRIFTAWATRDYYHEAANMFPQSERSLPFADRHIRESVES